MGFCYLKNILFISSLLVTNYCLAENLPDDTLLLNAVYQSSILPNRYTSKDFNACIVTANTVDGRISVCLNLSANSCSLDFLSNIKNNEILQKRKDDLTFININYTNCSTPGSTLFGKYNVMTPPASSLLQDYLKLNHSSLTITSKESCEKLGMFASKYVPENFVRILNENELKNTNSMEVELSLIPSTNNACITDLNFQPDFLPIIQSLRNSEFLRAVPCSHTSIPGYEKCPWLE